jgi:hypothetical protein
VKTDEPSDPKTTLVGVSEMVVVEVSLLTVMVVEAKAVL